MNFDFIVYFFKDILIFLDKYTHDWGWAIIILTLLIKIVLFPSSVKQFQSMQNMKRIQPKMQEIQAKYKDKPEEMQRRTMELYQKENVKPLGGCLPMLIQFPLLVAIYYLLSDPKFGVFNGLMKNAMFLGVSLTASHNILFAIISAATTFLQQKLTMPATPTGDNAQQQIFMYMMPLMLGFFTYNVNAGVGLYWIASNIIGIGQQYLINEYFIVKEQIHKDDAHKDDSADAPDEKLADGKRSSRK